MKKFLSIIMAIVTLLMVCVCFASCSTKNKISYGKKYMLNDKVYYVFYSDKTGYCEYYYKYDSSSDPSYNYTKSGRVEFVWREASDGAIYLFRTETEYNKDHVGEKSIPLIDEPIHFADDCFVYTNTASSRTDYAIKEGSKLEKVIED